MRVCARINAHRGSFRFEKHTPSTVCTLHRFVLFPVFFLFRHERTLKQRCAFLLPSTRIVARIYERICEYSRRESFSRMRLACNLNVAMEFLEQVWNAKVQSAVFPSKESANLVSRNSLYKFFYFVQRDMRK